MTPIQKRYEPKHLCKNCKHQIESHLNLDPMNKTCNYNETPGYGGKRCGCVKPRELEVKND